MHSQHSSNGFDSIASAEQIGFGMVEETLERKPQLSHLNWTCLIVSLLAYVCVHTILSRANILHAVPKCHDDYLNLSFDWAHLVYPATRPLTWLAISVCSAMGSRFFFAMMSFLTVSYVASVAALVCRLFEPRRIYPLIVFGLCFLTFCFENVVEYYKFTGTLANLCSGTLALISMHLFLSSFETEKSKLQFWGGILFFVLSLLTKEDFALPMVSFVFFFGFIARETAFQKVRGQRAFLICCALGAAYLLVQRWVAHNAFLSSQGSYQIDLTPVSILKVLGQYFFALNGSKVASAVQTTSLLFLLCIKTRKDRLRAALTILIPFTLVAPFLLLPNHIFKFYALNWIPWQFCSAFALLQMPSSVAVSRFKVALLFAVMVLAFISTNSMRHDLLRYYRREEVLNDNILETLQRNIDRLRRERVIEVFGIYDHSCPWFGPNDYLQKRLDLNCHWLLNVDADSDFYKTKSLISNDQWPVSVEIRKSKVKPEKTALAALRFDKAGNGYFECSNPRLMPEHLK